MILLGRTITIHASSQPSFTGLTGEVVEDTRETLVVRTTDGVLRTIVKNTITVNAEGRELGPQALRGTHATRLRR